MNIQTQSGGEVNIEMVKTKFDGIQIYLHIDQTDNINNGDDEASIILNLGECKSIINSLHDYVKWYEGREYFTIVDYTKVSATASLIP